MSARLSDKYYELIRGWNPPQLPKNFQNPEAIRKYQKEFREGYATQLNQLVGRLVNSRCRSDEPEVVVSASLEKICTQQLIPSHRFRVLEIEQPGSSLSWYYFWEGELSVDQNKEKDAILKKQSLVS